MMFKEDYQAFKGVITGLIICFIFLLAIKVVCARDNGQYSQVDPNIKKWIESLQDKSGVSCCNTADGYDAQWDTKDGHYRVFLEGQWIVVEDNALLDIPNKLGVARVWWFRTYDQNHKLVPRIRCFLPGSGT